MPVLSNWFSSKHLHKHRKQADCYTCPYIHQKDYPDHSYQCNVETFHLNPECGYNGYHCLLSGYDSVSCNTKRFKLCFLGNWRMTSVSPSEFPALINHYYCTSLIISYTYTTATVLGDVFDITIPWVQRFTNNIKLNCLFLCRSQVTDNFGMSFILTIHGNQEITCRGDTQITRLPSL